MKKLIFLFMLVPVLLFAQKPHSGFAIQEADSSGQTYWQIKGVESDTSEWYLSHEVMTIYGFAADTVITPANTDSTQATLYFQTTNTERTIPITDRTLSFSSDSTGFEWKITQVTIGNGMYWRLIITGGADNTNKYGSLWQLRYDGYPNVSR